jgi:hypothetical protein
MKHIERLIASAVCGAVGIWMASCMALQKPSRVEEALANAAKDVVIPIQAQNLKNPIPDTPDVVEQAHQIYNQSAHCVTPATAMVAPISVSA